MGKPRAEEVLPVAMPTNFEMDSWTREVIEKAASRSSGASRKVRILALRYERDDAYREIQRTWHRRLGWFITFLIAYYLFGGFAVVLVLSQWTFGGNTFPVWLGLVWFPILVVLVGYVVTGLVAAADRGFESYLFRRSLFWIEHREEASALLDAELGSDDYTPISSRIRIAWVWKFW